MEVSTRLIYHQLELRFSASILDQGTNFSGIRPFELVLRNWARRSTNACKLVREDCLRVAVLSIICIEQSKSERMVERGHTPDSGHADPGSEKLMMGQEDGSNRRESNQATYLPGIRGQGIMFLLGLLDQLG